MAHYQGTVSRIFEKNFGGKVKFSFFLDGVDGILFKMNERRPDFKEGGVIEFDANDKNFVSNLTSVGPKAAEVTPGNAPAPATAPALTSHVPVPSSSYARKWHRYEDRDYADAERRSIVRQKSLDLAIQAMPGLLTAEAVKLPTKAGQRLDSYLDYIQLLTDRFYADLAVDHGQPAPQTEPATPAEPVEEPSYGNVEE